MQKLMLPKILRHCKLFIVDITFVRFLSRVNKKLSIQGNTLCKTFADKASLQYVQFHASLGLQTRKMFGTNTMYHICEASL